MLFHTFLYSLIQKYYFLYVNDSIKYSFKKLLEQGSFMQNFISNFFGLH